MAWPKQKSGDENTQDKTLPPMDLGNTQLAGPPILTICLVFLYQSSASSSTLMLSGHHQRIAQERGQTPGHPWAEDTLN